MSQHVAYVRHLHLTVARHKPDLLRRRTRVARHVALPPKRLPEVLQQHLPAANVPAFAVREHAENVLPNELLVVAVGRRVRPVAQHKQPLRVVELVENDAVGQFAVPPRAPRLLEVVFDRLGYREVNDEPDVRLVDAHAEGQRRHHDGHRPRYPVPVVLGPGGHRHLRVVGRHRHVLRQALRHPLDLVAAQAVDDPAHPPEPRVHHIDELLDRLVGVAVLRHHFVAEVGPVEAGLEDGGRPQAELVADVGDDLLRGRGRERADGHVRELVFQQPHLLVVGPEVVSPLADAVGLIQHEPRKPALPFELPKGVEERLRGRDALRSDEQYVRRVAVRAHVPQDILSVRPADLPDKGVAGYSERHQPLHLVLYQRNQRHDDHGHPVQADLPIVHGRQLEAQRLPSSRRYHHERVPPAQDAVDDLQLLRAERRVSEYLVVYAMHELRPLELPRPRFGAVGAGDFNAPRLVLVPRQNVLVSFFHRGFLDRISEVLVVIIRCASRVIGRMTAGLARALPTLMRTPAARSQAVAEFVSDR
ncbi:uncharacterized protein BcabD6B2_25950 [Babesia caballi]|uniref:Uncharacterized protein n=1 Tax=Babesia caballi TaxID=5871 RepID=A0AAV4LTH8_BABCB|nr:hypothetical protein BcabD6B2_25950 [Babesia caballi]